jgi:hypothetical protein
MRHYCRGSLKCLFLMGGLLATIACGEPPGLPEPGPDERTDDQDQDRESATTASPRSAPGGGTLRALTGTEAEPASALGQLRWTVHEPIGSASSLAVDDLGRSYWMVDGKLRRYDRDGRLLGIVADGAFAPAGSSIETRWVASDASGRLYVVGIFSGELQLDDGSRLPSAGGSDVYVSRIASDGARLWTRRIGNEKHQEWVDFAVGPAGHVLVAPGYAETVLLDENGAVAWTRQLDVPVGRLAVDAGGRGFVFADFSGGITAAGRALESRGPRDLLLAKLDDVGQVTWLTQLGGDGREHATTIVADPSGSVYVAGVFFDELNLGGETLQAVESSEVSSDTGFVASFDAAGRHRWSRVAPAQAMGELNDLAVDSGGRLTLAGRSNAAVVFGFSDVAQYDAMSGSVMWSQNGFLGGGQGSARALAIDPLGGLLVSGVAEPRDATTHELDAHLARIE